MQKNLIFIPIVFITLSFSLLTGCESWLPEAHKIDIQQGNKVKKEDLQKLKLGMTRSQVKFVLGTPLLQDGFHNSRWDYMYYLKPGKNELKQSRIVLYFNGDELSKIDDSHFVTEANKPQDK
jgi:outer membrane protein assembly factor BamE